MPKTLLTLAMAATLALTACGGKVTKDEVGAGVAAGAVGAIAAELLGANPAWTIVAGAAAATAGAIYARNRETGQCAYGTGDGKTVQVKDCPKV
ncbi:MAG: glucose-6-phosphate isomerase [Rhodobacteraceae bacterium]|nr:glucose-6-phosphate isomerase [Paracoccaceae bacterium]